MVARLADVQTEIAKISERYLTLGSQDGWCTLMRFPFIHAGEEGVYNITPEQGILGLEIRPIPEDDLAAFMRDLREFCTREEFEIEDLLVHPGIQCFPENPYLQALISAVRRASGQEPVLGRKLAGTSARFAPDGQGVVWGQTGVHPHSRDEKHYIPSILPYYRALKEFEVTAAAVSAEGTTNA
jgi:acetylornithine deacetylase/succinyl-diaminopimelate desuccinylase-like protein